MNKRGMERAGATPEARRDRSRCKAAKVGSLPPFPRFCPRPGVDLLGLHLIVFTGLALQWDRKPTRKPSRKPTSGGFPTELRVLSERGVVTRQDVSFEFDLLLAARSVFEYSDKVSLCEPTSFPFRE
jgi:hypothetical protein